MTKVTILGATPEKKELKKIEFVKILQGIEWDRDVCEARIWLNITLLSRQYRETNLDLMFAWDSNPDIGALYLGHFNDGVV